MQKSIKSRTQIVASKRGFTLIELLVVIIIIGLLTTAAMFGYLNYRNKARHAIRLNELEELRRAVERYKSDKGELPSDSDYDTFTTQLEPYLVQIGNDPGSNSYQYATDPLNSLEYTFGGFDELGSTPSTPVYIKKGVGSIDVELVGTDGDPTTIPDNGFEFGCSNNPSCAP